VVIDAVHVVPDPQLVQHDVSGIKAPYVRLYQLSAQLAVNRACRQRVMRIQSVRCRQTSHLNRSEALRR